MCSAQHAEIFYLYLFGAKRRKKFEHNTSTPQGRWTKHTPVPYISVTGTINTTHLNKVLKKNNSNVYWVVYLCVRRSAPKFFLPVFVRREAPRKSEHNKSVPQVRWIQHISPAGTINTTYLNKIFKKNNSNVYWLVCVFGAARRIFLHVLRVFCSARSAGKIWTQQISPAGTLNTTHTSPVHQFRRDEVRSTQLTWTKCWRK